MIGVALGATGTAVALTDGDWVDGAAMAAFAVIFAVVGIRNYRIRGDDQ